MKSANGFHFSIDPGVTSYLIPPLALDHEIRVMLEETGSQQFEPGGPANVLHRVSIKARSIDRLHKRRQKTLAPPPEIRFVNR